MKSSLEEFIHKYDLDNFSETLELKGQLKVDFYNELIDLFKTAVRILDKAANIGSLRGFLVLMGLAKLSVPGAVINKSDVKDELNIDRLEKLMHAFEYLKKSNYINIIEKTPRFHIVRLNEEDNPDLNLLSELIKKYWNSPKEKRDKIQKWIQEDD